jgi:STE24 endopeptidase
MAVSIFSVILGILISTFLLERWLDHLNSTSWSPSLPDSLAGICDADKYAKSRHYYKSKLRFSQVTDSVTMLILLGLLITGGFIRIDLWVSEMSDNPILITLLFFGILGAGSSLIAIPFELYGVFVLESKFQFNTMTPGTFILDKIKGWLLTAVIGGALIALVAWVYQSTGNFFWLITWGVVTLLMIFITMFYSTLIVPLFNRQKPLETGPLRDAIEDFAGSVGFRIENIYVIDGSKRSRKANAYFSGMGSKKRIVLYDTLISDHSIPELVAVLAHEIGHYKMKHTLQGILLAVVQSGLMLFVMSLFIRQNSTLSEALCQSLSGLSGIQATPGFHLGILAFIMLYSPLALLLGIVVNLISRNNELKADRFARMHGQQDALMEALKKLSVNNLSNLSPHPLYVFFYYSHPPLLQRLAALKGLSSTSQQKQSRS